VKIQKPEDEKYFKDIVLNDILEEISNETKVTSEYIPMSKNNASTKKFFSAKKILSFILLLIVSFIIFFILSSSTVTIVTPKTQEMTTDTQEWKMEEDRTDYDHTRQHKETVKQKTVPNVVIIKKVIEEKPMPPKKTEREVAKEQLKQQMLN